MLRHGRRAAQRHVRTMGYTLHAAVIREAQQAFGPEDIDYVLARLAGTPLPLERSGPPPRVHLAVIWLSKGERRWFDHQIEGARRDWRDTLVEAGLAGEDWREVVKRRGTDCTDW
jgi:hypothetical protein